MKIEVGDERAVSDGDVLVPAMGASCVSQRRRDASANCGFFSSNTVLPIADDIVEPIGSRVIGTPPPEMTGAV